MSVYHLPDLAEEQLNPYLSRKLVSGSNIMLAFLVMKRGAEVPSHSHVNEQVSYVMQGALRFSVNKRTVTIRSGDVLVIPPNAEHSAEALEDTHVLDIFSPPRQDWIQGRDQYLRSDPSS